MIPADEVQFCACTVDTYERDTLHISFDVRFDTWLWLYEFVVWIIVAKR